MINKLMNIKVLLLIAPFLFHSSCLNQQEDVSGAAYNILSPSKYNALQQKYLVFEDFENGTSRVKTNSGWGLINTKGKEVVKAEYDTIYPLLHNFRIVKKDSKYGLIDTFGKETITCKYEDFREYLGNGLFPFQINGKWGFVSNNDDVKVQFKYESLSQILDSVFVGQINGYEGLFDYEEKVIINPEYDRILYRPYVHSNVSYARKGDKYAIINTNNELVSKCVYSSWPIPYGDYVTFRNIMYDRYCMVNWESGDVVIPYGYEDLGHYIDDVVYACKNDKYGYVNTNNEVVIPFKFADASDFSEGLAMVAVYSGKYLTFWGEYLQKKRYGFIDKEGNWVIRPTFADQSLSWGNGFNEGLAVMGVESDSNIYPEYYGYINKTGEWVINPIYKKAYDFENGVAVVETSRGYGAIDKEGKIIVEPRYKSESSREKNGSILVFEDAAGKEFRYSLDGAAI